MRPTLIALTTTLLLAAAPGIGQSIAPQPSEPVVSRDDARRIATDHGVVRIEDISLDSGIWLIDGRDVAGAEIEIDLRATDGKILRVERERPASASLTP